MRCKSEAAKIRGSEDESAIQSNAYSTRRECRQGGVGEDEWG